MQTNLIYSQILRTNYKNFITISSKMNQNHQLTHKANFQVSLAMNNTSKKLNTKRTVTKRLHTVATMITEL